MLQAFQIRRPLCRRRYGIGQIYLRQEKWAQAHYHFRTAAAINKRSSVLHCYTGMALHRQGLHAEALQCLQVRTGRTALLQLIAHTCRGPSPPAKHADTVWFAAAPAPSVLPCSVCTAQPGGAHPGSSVPEDMRFSGAAVCPVQDAIKVDPRNPLARFERAAVLEDQGRLQEALHELAALKVPKHACRPPINPGHTAGCFCQHPLHLHLWQEQVAALHMNDCWLGAGRRLCYPYALAPIMCAAAAGAGAAGGQRVLQDGAHAPPPQPAGRDRHGAHRSLTAIIYHQSSSPGLLRYALSAIYL
jgi:Tetratricopeptide repeat